MGRCGGRRRCQALCVVAPSPPGPPLDGYCSKCIRNSPPRGVKLLLAGGYLPTNSPPAGAGAAALDDRRPPPGLSSPPLGSNLPPLGLNSPPLGSNS
eukprot:4919789-Pyramimonas_sp.AAC.1